MLLCLVLFVFDGNEYAGRQINEILAHYLQTGLFTDKKIIVVCNKIDLSLEQAQVSAQKQNLLIYLSAKTGEGIDLLRQEILKTVGGQQEVSGSFIARRRHITAIEKAKNGFDRAKIQFYQQQAGELLAEDLREVQSFLGEIIGQITSDELLGKIFSSFCIGK